MPCLVVTRRDVAGFVSAALLGRYCRYHLLEDIALGPEELLFSHERRLAALLRDAVPLAEGTLTRIFIAGIGAPADRAGTLAALERLDFLGVEVEWFDAHAWDDPAFARRASEHAHLVLRGNRGAAPAQFLHDALGLSDHRSTFIVETGHASAATRWHLLLRALRHEHHQPEVREHLRRLAFGSLRLGENEVRLIAEEMERLRWLRNDLRLLVPFPVKQTRTRQAMALVDVRKETGAPVLRAEDVARRVSRSQPVRYTLIALSRDGAWSAHLHSWPRGVGDLAGIAELPGAADGGFRMTIESRSAAIFEALDPRLSFFDLAHDVAGRL